MPATLSEVKQLLQDAFPGSNVEGVKDEGHRIGGTIVWKGFRGMDMRQRDRAISEKVRDKLKLRGLNVDLLIPIAPGEKL